MLPFALKVVWFCLSFTGIIACWVVLSIFSRAIGSSWGPHLYSIFATILQGIFCLGMVYDMNPFRMPKAFCIAQTFIIYYAAWSLTGVCAAFTFATTGSVLWPSSMIRTTASTLAWDNRYYFPILIFPLACLSISVPVLLKLDAIRPTDDLHCDASHPIWGRFLGYAGFSMLPTIPCFFLSAAAAYRVLQIHINNQRSQVFRTTRSYSRSQFSSDRHATTLEFASPITLPVTATTAPLDLETSCFSESQKGALPRLIINEDPLDHVDDMYEIDDPSPHVLPSPVFASPSSHQKSPTRWEATATTSNLDDEFSPRRQTTSIPASGKFRLLIRSTLQVKGWLTRIINRYSRRACPAFKIKPCTGYLAVDPVSDVGSADSSETLPY
ncbi:hypothetical protein PAXINDRAFT_104026 [Paxillus involutus ATCC 200175]|uniref:Uncharacterized protein n=1 Tax=Paxillus involutus ATCC 200175 TaxID=664439 RepID=A0A0C9T014_PAXIN|nr:hypothetical protein PAXINDRAFT_104026 [Paxillus involutus ATCC 200175]